MEYFIDCKPVGFIKKLVVYNSDLEAIGSIKMKKPSSGNFATCEITDRDTLIADLKPFKLKNRFQITTINGDVKSLISTGFKIIHSVVKMDKYYFVKASFWKVHYKLYDDRMLKSELFVTKQNGKRYYKVVLKEDDHVNLFSLYLLAHELRLKSIMN